MKGPEIFFSWALFSTGIMLMGIAFIFKGNPSGSFFLNNIQIGNGPMPVMIAVGLVLLLVSICIQGICCSFPFLNSDVYDGAPTVFTSFMSTIVKAAGFFVSAFVPKCIRVYSRQWQNLIVFITTATLFIGNITAGVSAASRMLAYSSIAQAGFMLFGLLP